MAEKEGFEPSRRSSRPTPLAGEPLRPLGYFSMVEKLSVFSHALIKSGGESGIRTHGSFESPVFKTGSINHSDISPYRRSNAGVIITYSLVVVNDLSVRVSLHFQYALLFEYIESHKEDYLKTFVFSSPYQAFNRGVAVNVKCRYHV